jgi:hypothetical protein
MNRLQLLCTLCLPLLVACRCDLGVEIKFAQDKSLTRDFLLNGPGKTKPVLIKGIAVLSHVFHRVLRTVLMLRGPCPSTRYPSGHMTYMCAKGITKNWQALKTWDRKNIIRLHGDVPYRADPWRGNVTCVAHAFARL